MKVSMNPIGNYTNLRNQPIKRAAKANSLENSSDVISNKEKEFFINKYPQNKTEINNHHFYQRSGKMTGISVGTLINKRV